MNQLPDVPNRRLNFQDLIVRAREIVFFLPTFLKNPLEQMKRVPSWDWPTVIILEILLSATTSVIGGILSRHWRWLAIVGGLIIGPLMGLIVSAFITAVLYYSCLFILKTELEIRKIFIVVVLAEIPWQILGILTGIARPVTLIGLIVTALLLIVGLSENFMLPKKKVSQIVGTMTCLAIFIWLYASVVDATSNHIKVEDYTPETLDQIHKELGR